MSNLKSIIGCSDNETVMLDFDNVSYPKVKYWALRTNRWFKLGGFVIFKSSKNHYHVIFNKKVTWKRNIHIMDWVALESHYPKLKDYAIMQGIKESSTLRISTKREKPSPRIVFRFGKQDKQIQDYLKFRRMIKGIIKGIVHVPSDTLEHHLNTT